MNISCKFNGIKDFRDYLKNLMKSGKIDEVLAPVLNSSKSNYIQGLISSESMLDNINPFAPVIPVQTGRIAKNLTFTKSSKKLMIIAKPCEIKAIVELTKFKQIDLDNCFLIATDCSGTYEVSDFEKLITNNPDYVENYPKIHSNGDLKSADGFSFRKSCTICETPSIDPKLPDAVIGYYGGDGGIIFTLKEGSKLFDTVESQSVDLSKRESTISKVVSERIKSKADKLAEFKKSVNSIDGLKNLLSKCIRCHNCMVACPICYCKECVFRSPTFDHSADTISGWAERKGALRMLENTTMFHLTRLNHMSSSCIACGLCSSACPNDIDVATLFISSAESVQKMLEYKAGESFDTPAPVVTFRENEFIIEADTN